MQNNDCPKAKKVMCWINKKNSYQKTNDRYKNILLWIKKGNDSLKIKSKINNDRNQKQ